MNPRSRTVMESTDPLVTVTVAVPGSRIADIYHLAAAAIEGRPNPRSVDGWTPEARAKMGQHMRRRLAKP